MSCEFKIHADSLDKSQFVESVQALFATRKFVMVRGIEDYTHAIAESAVPCIGFNEEAWYLIEGGTRGITFSVKQTTLNLHLPAFSTKPEWEFVVAVLQVALANGGKIEGPSEIQLSAEDLSDAFITEWQQAYWNNSMSTIITAFNSTPEDSVRYLPTPCFSLKITREDFKTGEQQILKTLLTQADKYAHSGATRTVSTTTPEGQAVEAALYLPMPTLIENTAQYIVSYGPMGSHYAFTSEDFYDIARQFTEVESQDTHTYVNAIPQNKVEEFYNKMRAHKDARKLMNA